MQFGCNKRCRPDDTLNGCDALPAVPFPFDQIWFFSLLGLLVAIIIVAQPRRLILVFVVLAGLLSMWDQTRWQPWFYQYFFMLAAIGLRAAKTRWCGPGTSPWCFLAWSFFGKTGKQVLAKSFFRRTSFMQWHCCYLECSLPLVLLTVGILIFHPLSIPETQIKPLSTLAQR